MKGLRKLSRRKVEEILKEHLEKISQGELSEKDLDLLLEELELISKDLNFLELRENEIVSIKSLISNIINLVEKELFRLESEISKKEKGLNAHKVYMLHYRD